MTSKAICGTSGDGRLGRLCVAALTATLIGAVGSAGFTVYAGRHNHSRVLVVLFVVWVLSPFLGLVAANLISRDWPVLTQATLYSLMLVLALSSLAIYGDVALGLPRRKMASFFLVVPLASWLLMATALPIAALVSGKLSRRNGAPK